MMTMMTVIRILTDDYDDSNCNQDWCDLLIARFLL